MYDMYVCTWTTTITERNSPENQVRRRGSLSHYIRGGTGNDGI